MLEILQPALGFVSASLVALIALGFGAMLLFFSGSALLVFGQFLPFTRKPMVAGLAALIAAPVLGIAFYLARPELAEGGERWWLIPSGMLAQLLCTGLVYLLIRFAALARAARWMVGTLLLAAGLLWVATFWLRDLAPLAVSAIAIAAATLNVAITGVWPLAVAGLVEHRRARPVEWFISLRYLVAKRRQTFISVITVICVSGVALGVAVITVVLSVMNGFNRMWEEKIIGHQAPAVVHEYGGPMEGYQSVRDEIVRVPGVLGASPFLSADAIMRGAGGDLQAIHAQGD